MTCIGRILTSLIPSLLLTFQPGLQAAEGLPPDFKEVFDVLKSNLVESGDGRLERAVVDGLVRELSPQVAWVTNTSAVVSNRPLVSKSLVFDGTSGYLRLGHVGAGLAREVAAAMASLSSSNKIKGWVLDLRQTDGFDYKAAAEAAGGFVGADKPLIDYGQGMVRSEAGDKAVKGPVMVLVNRRTAGAAEALAAILRQTATALLLGTNTAGQAFVTRDCPLRNGRQLRVATALVKIGDGRPLSLNGVKPDIMVSVRPEDELAYLDDPYRVISRPGFYGTRLGSESGLASASTNRSGRHRLNEAELVRMLREGLDYDEDSPGQRTAEPNRPVVHDPVLARALDLIKGLAVARGGAGGQP